MNSIQEFNFDGLIGPTHNYAGLSHGNVASAQHRNQISSPRQAALQGLAKMKTLADLGIGQALLPPLFRPRLDFLTQLGITGSPAQQLESAWRISPALLASCYSASNMWTANAATVTPSTDSLDGRLHVTPANLSSTLHRSIEPPSTRRNLQAIFPDDDYFVVHPALPNQSALADEGAANHTRLGPIGFKSSAQGIHLFAYGRDDFDRPAVSPNKYPARQTRLASQSIARHHQLSPERTFFWRQSPAAIDAGVFHNDVIAVGHQNVLLCQQHAFVDQANQLNCLRECFENAYQQPLVVIDISNQELSLTEAVSSYLFNSQIVTRPDGGMTIICPQECQSHLAAKRCIERLVDAPGPIDQSLFLDLRQSMNNGGGPACLRLRVAITPEQQRAIHPGVFFTPERYDQLCQWVQTHYREQLHPDDLRDPALLTEVRRAFEALATIIDLPAEILIDDRDT